MTLSSGGGVTVQVRAGSDTKGATMDEERRLAIEQRLVTYRDQRPGTGSAADWYIRDVAWLLTELHLIGREQEPTPSLPDVQPLGEVTGSPQPLDEDLPSVGYPVIR